MSTNTDNLTDCSYQCRFCQKTFRRETSLLSHVCEQKKRHQSRNEVGVQWGLQSYLKFYQYSQSGSRNRSWDDFVTSPYYRAFVKFGNYCHTTPVVAVMQYLEWLLKKNKKLDHWCKDSVYNEFLLQHLKNEAVEDALTRAIKWSMTWEEQNNAPARDCIRFGSANVICHAIVSGKISAWAIYNSASGRDFLNQLTGEQLKIVYDYIDPEFWQAKFVKYPEDTAYCQQLLNKAGW
jgi:hypothetical protein